MTPEISERAFEDAIERTLLDGGPDAEPGEATAFHDPPAPVPYGTNGAPGGYDHRTANDEIA